MPDENVSKESKTGKALRDRAGNRALLMVNLSDPEARIARVILEHIADALDGREMPEMKTSLVVKRPHV